VTTSVGSESSSSEEYEECSCYFGECGNSPSTCSCVKKGGEGMHTPSLVLIQKCHMTRKDA
jgi:hypothetical protein